MTTTFTDIGEYGQFHYDRHGRNEGRELIYGDPQDVYGTPQPTTTITLDPEKQAQYDALNGINNSLLATGQQQLDRVNASFNTPLTSDWLRLPNPEISKGLFDVNSDITSGLRERTVDPSVHGYEAVADALRERASQGFDQQRSASEANLAARGFSPGGSGYDGRMDNINRQENDFGLAATLAAGDAQARMFGMEGDLRAEGAL